MNKTLCIAGLLAPILVAGCQSGSGGSSSTPLTVTVLPSTNPYVNEPSVEEAWGPWNELPAYVRETVAGRETFDDWNTGRRNGIPIFTLTLAEPTMPRLGKMVWKGDLAPGVMHEKVREDTVNPMIHIIYENTNWSGRLSGEGKSTGLRSYFLKDWDHLQWENGAFSQDGLTGQFVKNDAEEWAVYGTIVSRYMIGSYVTNAQKVPGK